MGAYDLMEEEIDNFDRFKVKHRNCNPKIRETLMEEEAAPAYHDIILHMTSIGMTPMAKCHVCGDVESIICDERLNNF